MAGRTRRDRDRDDVTALCVLCGAAPEHRFRVLHLVVCSPGIGAGELARSLGLRPAAVSAAVTSLQQGGLLTRAVDGSDARRLCFTATEAGLSLHAQALPGALSELRAALARLPEGALESLLLRRGQES